MSTPGELRSAVSKLPRKEADRLLTMALVGIFWDEEKQAFDLAKWDEDDDPFEDLIELRDNLPDTIAEIADPEEDDEE